jgi:hypothetical protein
MIAIPVRVIRSQHPFALDHSSQEYNKRNNKQHVNERRSMKGEESHRPPDNEDTGNNIKQIGHTTVLAKQQGTSNRPGFTMICARAGDDPNHTGPAHCNRTRKGKAFIR